MNALATNPELSEEAWKRASTHPYETVRSTTIDLHPEQYEVNGLFDLLSEDPSSRVRQSAIYAIATTGNIVFAKKAATIGMADESYEVQKQAISIEYAIDQVVGGKIIDSLEVNNPLPYLDIISDIKSQELTEEDLSFYREYLDQGVDLGIYYMVNDYIALSKTLSPTEIGKSITHFTELKSYTNEYYKAYLYNGSIDTLKEALGKALKNYEGEDKAYLEGLVEE